MGETADPDVADSLDALIRAIHREYRTHLNERDLDLTLPEIQALRFLERHPGAGLHQLTQESGRDKAQITRTMRALEDKGLIRRARNPDDQRCHRLHLSDQGRETRAVIHRIRSGIEARLFAELDADQQHQLAALLRQCLASLQATERHRN